MEYFCLSAGFEQPCLRTLSLASHIKLSDSAHNLIEIRQSSEGATTVGSDSHWRYNTFTTLLSKFAQNHYIYLTKLLLCLHFVLVISALVISGILLFTFRDMGYLGKLIKRIFSSYLKRYGIHVCLLQWIWNIGNPPVRASNNKIPRTKK